MSRHSIEHVEPCDRLRNELLNFEPQRVRLCGNAVALIHARNLFAANADSQIGSLIEYHSTLTYSWATTDVLYAEPVLADWTSPEYNVDMFRTCVGTEHIGRRPAVCQGAVVLDQRADLAISVCRKQVARVDQCHSVPAEPDALRFEVEELIPQSIAGFNMFNRVTRHLRTPVC
jgi:hypothetical protein